MFSPRLLAQLSSLTVGRLAFGDSYTFVQGTEGHQGYSFIGDNLNLSYTREKLYGDKIVKNQVSSVFYPMNWSVLTSEDVCGWTELDRVLDGLL